MNTDTAAYSAATGPKTTEGKRVAARNATTHGLFARDVVLTHLGEDPAGYEALLKELAEQLQPKNLLEQHYTEKIAAASWRLRRLQRWQAQLFEDPDITEDQALEKLDRVMRHESALHRQIDTSVKMLAREIPKLFQDRVRAELIRGMNATEKDCQEDPYMNEWIISETRRRIPSAPIPASLDPATFDAAPDTTQNCQNEPAPLSSPSSPCSEGEVARLAATEGVPLPEGVPPASRPFIQNEPLPPPVPTLSFPKERVDRLAGPGEVSSLPGKVSGSAKISDSDAVWGRLGRPQPA